MKYKLIKKYPESPKLGCVIVATTTSDDCRLFVIENSSHSFGIQPSKFPEFWQKIEEVDYEILNFNLKKVGYTTPCKNINQSLSILSVKRISDGAIFTIGDSVRFYPKAESCFFEIDNFFICEKQGLLVRSKDNMMVETISTIKHPDRLPLFTTEDRVEIFEGQSYAYTPKVTMKYINVSDGNSIPMPKESFFYFSTKEKAEEYILMNKPCLSIKDVAPIFGQMHLDNSLTVLTRMTAKLQELVKSKS
jgi:hypothetical protein